MPSSKDLALSWGRLNLRVFPVALIGHDKVPWVAWKTQATFNLETLSTWFDRWPTTVPGVVMEGVCAIDFDRPAAQWEYGYEWPETWSQETRRGIHYVYEGAVPCSVKVLAPDIDTRGTVNDRSGYIVAYREAPTTRDAFAPAPSWLRDWANARSRQTQQAFTEDDGVAFDTSSNIRRATERLLSIAPGGRHDTRIPIGHRNNFIFQAAREMQKFDLTRETTLELMVTLFEWEGSFEENITALDSAFATRHPEAGTLNPERVFADRVAEITKAHRLNTGLSDFIA